MYGRIALCSVDHGGPRPEVDIGVGNPSPEMLENGRFRLSSTGCGDGKTSVGVRLTALSSTDSTLPPSLPSIVLILSASSLMYLRSVD